MKEFELYSEFAPTGDQPQAIAALTAEIEAGSPHNVLLGVTGSGKTFTMANIISAANRPTLILSHNKTLAAQLYGEFKNFFPNNAVEYFVSYYDYYQPEAYLPTSDTYIEKDLAINEEIEKLRLSTSSTLLSGRRDVVVVSSVSCLYGIGNPADFHSNTIELKRGERYPQRKILYELVNALYSRAGVDFKRGTFRVSGDTIDVFVAYGDIAYRIVQWGDEIEALHKIDPVTGARLEQLDNVSIHPANIFVTTKERTMGAVKDIQTDLGLQIKFFEQRGEVEYARRLKGRVEYDLEMIKEIGYCSGIENYSRYFDGRTAGTRPFCLMDYFPSDFLMFIDESHVTIPQVKAMYGGDASRKKNLVEYGFRLPAAIDNRPLTFDEFVSLQPQTIYVSATPADYELTKSEGVVVEQLIRPTGLLDPIIEVRPTGGQINDLLREIKSRTVKQQRILVTTITKRMAEELSKFLDKKGVKCRYIHSDIDTMERIEIMDGLRAGVFDVLVGVNLLREGLDLPEVSLVAIMDADKEGFLRNTRSLTQTAGRAARHLDGYVIMYGDRVTASMAETIAQSERRREKQLNYNVEHNITPAAISKALRGTMGASNPISQAPAAILSKAETQNFQNLTPAGLEKAIVAAKLAMEQAAEQLDFTQAAILRDRMYAMQDLRQKS